MNKLLPLIAFSIFAVAAVGSQQAFAGITPIVGLLEDFTSGSGFATIEYELTNNSDLPFFQPPGPLSVFGFAVEVDPGFFEDIDETNHSRLGPGFGRDDWCIGTDCGPEGPTVTSPLILAPEWNAGIELTTLFGGLSTNDIGLFDDLFTTHDQVALFYNPDLNNMVVPGEVSALNDFTVTGPQLIPSSDIVFLCLDQTNQLVDCVTGIPYTTQEELLIGGEMMSLNSSALLLAGAQMTAAWLIPAIVSAVGISLVLVRRK